MSVPVPPNEAERLQILREHQLLDTPPEAVFDEIVALASFVFHAPMALVGLLDERRLWFKARMGLELAEAPREFTFSAYAILRPEGLVVPDALADPRFAANPFVLGKPGIRFYAGTPLLTREGQALGVLAILDTQPRLKFDMRQLEALHILGRHLMAHIEVRHSSRFLSQALMERNQMEAEAHRRLREHEAELGHVSEMKDRFVSLLAHELRNPLASILNALEILRSPDPEDAAEIIETQVRHLARLVEDLMDLSRVSRGKLALRKIPLDLTEAVRRAVRAVRPSFAKGGQKLAVDLPAEAIWVEADPVRLEQIVSNLLGNAAKFTEPGKKVSFSLHGEAKEAILRVRDEGIGISREMLDRIFEPFVQEETSRRRGGLGLGLPLVRQLVHLHQGKVEARSDGTGQGCEFTVRLPRLTDAASAKNHVGRNGDLGETNPAKVAKPQAQEPAERCRVLVVDDNSEFGSTLKRLLNRWGHEALLVASGTEALDEALRFQPDIALVDLGLPGMDGFAVGECLCGSKELAGLRLVAMSGYGEEMDRANAAKAGFHDFLLKPVEPRVLREMLDSLRESRAGLV